MERNGNAEEARIAEMESDEADVRDAVPQVELRALWDE
jgi:hypothetical protein